MKRSFFFALAAGVTLALAAPASADEWTSTHSQSVSYADLDLATDSGADTLLTRIKTAARHVCRFPGMSGVDQMVAERQCRRETVEQAVARLSNPFVTARYEQRPVQTAMR